MSVAAHCGDVLNPDSSSSPPRRQDSGSSITRSRPTTLDIPGLTKSKASPDGRISSRDIGSKLVIVMVGLPARGKSYITKKVARYLNWLQHNTRIFNVGERRRVAAGAPPRLSACADTQSAIARREESVRQVGVTTAPNDDSGHNRERLDTPTLAATILINGQPEQSHEFEALPPPIEDNFESTHVSTPEELPNTDAMEQSAYFFDPRNVKAAKIREQVAMATLDELLDFVLVQGGSVGIMDATNSTLERRKAIMKRVRERAGPELGVLFLESLCEDPNVSLHGAA